MPKKPTQKIRNFFIGNVSYSGTEAELLDFLRFETEVDLAEVKICLDKETQRPRGFGFVTIGSHETLSTPEIIKLADGLVFHGRELRAAPANEKPAKPARERQANFTGEDTW